jgi:predicted ArsR family transcriptional regulator
VVFIGERTPHEARDGDPASPLESRTRSRVLHMVSAEGPITAAELGRHLELTPAAVRRHLDALVEQGTVVEHEPTGGKRGRGRPARAYVVSEAGHGSLEADYDSLAVEVLRYLSEHGGPQAVADFARSRVGALETRYAAELAAAGDDPAARAETLVDLLSQDGFAASARPVGVGSLSGVQLCQGHCPVQHAAEQFPAFCEAETDAFSRLLGVHVQRLATLAGGHHVCTTFIPASGLARKPRTDSGVDQRVPDAQVTAPGERAQRHTTTSNEPTKERSRS